MVINNMEYNLHRYPHNDCIILAYGEHRGFNYWAISMGTHPCCYIEIPSDNVYYRVAYDDVDCMCHGGLTYSSDILTNVESNRKNNRWFIGWDYAHYGDYVALLTLGEEPCVCNNYKYSSEVLENDCINAIDDLIKNMPK